MKRSNGTNGGHEQPIEFSQLAVSEYSSKGSLDSLGNFLSAVERHKLVAAITFVLVAAMVAGLIVLLPAKFSAESRLFITRSRLDAPLKSDDAASPPIRGDVSEEEVASEMELLKSRDLLAQIVDAGLAGSLADAPDIPRQKERLLRRLDKDLKVQPVKKTSLISVHYAAKDPAQAANVVNKVTDLYLEKHMAIHRNREASQFFTQQATYYQGELKKAERDLQDFEQHNQSSLLPLQKEAALKRSNDIEATAEDTHSQIRDAEQRAAELRKQLRALPATLNTQNRSARNDALIQNLKTLLVQLQNKRTELLTKYEPGYRLVYEVDQQINDTTQAINREMTPEVVDRVDGLNPVRQTIEADLFHTESIVAGLREKQHVVASDNRRYHSRQQALALLTARDEDLRRRVKIAEENYLLYQKRQEEARIAEALDRQKFLNVSIVERAVAAALPDDRHRLFIAALGLLLALLISLAAALATDQLDRPVHSASELEEAAGLPVFATVSRSGT